MPEEWYFCLEHRRVEARDGCPVVERLGPYPTKELAAKALEIAAARNLAWDTDPRWDDEDD